MTDPDRTDTAGPVEPGGPAGSLEWTLDQLPELGDWIAELGLVIEELSTTRVRGHIELGPRHHTPMGQVHGGVYATLVETVGSIGAILTVLGRGQVAVGVNNSTDFLRPMTEGRMEIVAEPIQQGRVQQLWNVEMRRATDGTLVAQGRLRLQNVPLVPPDPKMADPKMADPKNG